MGIRVNASGLSDCLRKWKGKKSDWGERKEAEKPDALEVGKRGEDSWSGKCRQNQNRVFLDANSGGGSRGDSWGDGRATIGATIDGDNGGDNGSDSQGASKDLHY